MFASVSHVLTIEIESLKEWEPCIVFCLECDDNLFVWKFVIIKTLSIWLLPLRLLSVKKFRFICEKKKETICAMSEKKEDREKQCMKWNEHNEHCLFDFSLAILLCCYRCCCIVLLPLILACLCARPSFCFVLFRFIFFFAVYLTMC